MKLKLFFIAILLIFVLPVKLALANQPVIITDTQDKYPLGLCLDILEDKTGKLTFEDIQKTEYQSKFVPSKVEVPNYGFTSSAYWVRFNLKNTMTNNEELLLEFSYPSTDNLYLYISQSDNKFIIKKTGRFFPFNKRDIDHRYFLFRMPILKGEIKTIYIFVETNTVNLPVTLWKVKSFWEYEQTSILFYGALSGILIAMFLYNLIIFISIKNRNYLFYIIYLFFITLSFSFQSGFFYQYLWFNNSALNPMVYPIIFNIFLISGIWFSINFLNLSKNAPIAYKLFIIMIMLVVISGLLTLINKIRISFFLTNILQSISLVSIIIVAIYVYFKGYRAARFFITAWLVLLSGGLLYTLANLGVLPINTFTSHSFQFGLILEVVLLSFALADRINLAQEEKLETQKKSLKQLEDFLLVLASAIESKDAYTGGHVERVANYARDLAEKAGIDGENLRNLYLGAMVHDVGKIGVSDHVLNKPGKLDSDEMKEMQTHPLIGKQLLSRIDGIEVASNIVFSHQEKYDGSGYPQSLIKNEISREARIVTIADYWDAIITDRPYRKAMPLKKAISIMKEEAGKAFDPELFKLFMNDIDKLYLKYVDKEKLKELEEAE